MGKNRKRKNQEYVSDIIGIRNLGNTCYMYSKKKFSSPKFI